MTITVRLCVAGLAVVASAILTQHWFGAGRSALVVGMAAVALHLCWHYARRSNWCAPPRDGRSVARETQPIVEGRASRP
jgi:hypothetical protein